MTMSRHKNNTRKAASRNGFVCGEPTINDLFEMKKKVKSFVNYYRNVEPSLLHLHSPGEHTIRVYHLNAGDEEPEVTVWSSSLSCRNEILAGVMADYAPSSITMAEDPNMLIAFFDEVVVVIE